MLCSPDPPAISERPIDSTEISEVPAVPSGHIGQRPCTGLHGRRPSVKNSQSTRHDSSSAPQAAVSRAAGGRAPRSQTAWKLNRSLKRLLTTGPSFRCFFQPKAERNTSPFRKPLRKGASARLLEPLASTEPFRSVFSLRRAIFPSAGAVVVFARPVRYKPVHLQTRDIASANPSASFRAHSPKPISGYPRRIISTFSTHTSSQEKTTAVRVQLLLPKLWHGAHLSHFKPLPLWAWSF